MSLFTDEARAVIAAGKLAHLVTLNADGAPQVSVVWIGRDGDEIVSGHLGDRQKLRNVRRDPRVAVSIETGQVNAMGLGEYLVVHGTARVTERGAAELLQRLAHGYLGPDVTFPPGTNHPPGLILRVTATARQRSRPMGRHPLSHHGRPQQSFLRSRAAVLRPRPKSASPPRANRPAEACTSQGLTVGAGGDRRWGSAAATCEADD